MVCHQEHCFYTPEDKGQRKVLFVLLLTLITMVLEIVSGYIFNSVALLADGIHMSTHVVAFGVAYLAYYLAKRWVGERSFTFGTWKVEVLGAYTSGLLLSLLSFLIVEEAVSKLIKGGEVEYNQALVVSSVGLVVNLISVYVLHDHYEERAHSHQDLNLKGAYLHAVADALTSVLAIVGLLSGKFLGLWFMDPLVGFAGFVLILKWSTGLLKDSAFILLDREGSSPLAQRLVDALEEGGEGKVYDLHLLRISNSRYACILGIETTGKHDLEHYKRLLSKFKEVAHVTIELRRCVNS